MAPANMATAGQAGHSRDESAHFVRFYHADSLLVDEIAEFCDRALRVGGRAIVIATQPHLSAVVTRLQECDVAGSGGAPYAGRLIALDAEQTLSQFMVDGWPDEARFFASIGTLVGAAAVPGQGPVHAFGEMVSVLCERGLQEAALRLETLWNELARRHSFSLFCAYPQALFLNADDGPVFEHICLAHTHVLPSELLASRDETQTHRLVALWQQKAMALEREVERRTRAEATLREAQRQRDALFERTHAERERLVAELRDAARAKDEFLAMLGHELRNPLSPIVTALRLMRMRPEGNTAREQDIIARQVDHLVRLVDDLLDVSRITRGKIELRKQRVGVAEVLDSAVEMANFLLEQRRHRLTVDVDEHLVWNVDATRLAQVVSNLLTNAARYTSEGGNIELVAKREASGMIAVSVRDDGIGLAPDTLSKVFDLFFQGKRDLDRAEGGLGIGLALVKNLVELHGGRASVTSAGPGRGSTFVIRVPAEQAEPIVPAAPAASTAPTAPAASIPSEAAGRIRDAWGSTDALDLESAAARAAHIVAEPNSPSAVGAPSAPRRVLLVDDNVDGVQALAELLRECGHEVEAVYDPASALQVAQRFAPEIAVIDIGLPVMDGFELVHRLRTEPTGGGCLFVALTGYGQDADRDRSRAAGFDHHFVKPLDPSRLLSLIDALSPSVPSLTERADG